MIGPPLAFGQLQRPLPRGQRLLGPPGGGLGLHQGRERLQQLWRLQAMTGLGLAQRGLQGLLAARACGRGLRLERRRWRGQHAQQQDAAQGAGDTPDAGGRRGIGGTRGWRGAGERRQLRQVREAREAREAT